MASKRSAARSMNETHLAATLLVGRRQLLAALAGVCGLGFIGGASAQSAPQPIILSPGEAAAKAAAGEIVLIDVRRPEEHRASGVGADAVLADMTSRDFGSILMTALDGDRSRPVALICATGIRSARVASFLVENGFTAVHDVSEGMMGGRAGPGWIARDLPLRRIP